MCARKFNPVNESDKISKPVNRRTALARLTALASVAGWPGLTQAGPSNPENNITPANKKPVRKIATEEAFMIPEVATAMRNIVRSGGPNLDIKLLKTVFDAPAATSSAGSSQAPPTVSNRDAGARLLLPKLLDLDAGRLADMDASGVDVHVLSLGLPGVQLFEADLAVNLATLSNDQLSEAIRRHPKRFAGLACFAPKTQSRLPKKWSALLTSSN